MLNMPYNRRCWAEIDLDNIAYNYAALRAPLRPATKVMAVVKANAYGHGDRQMGLFMQEIGADWLGVACLDEALCLRRAGCELPILILGHTPPELAPLLREYELTQTVYSPEYAEALHATSEKIRAQIKLDTGMHRIGYRCDDMPSLEKAFGYFEISGLFTHFCCADDLSPESLAYSEKQFALFTETCEALRAKGYDTGLCHCSASAAAIAHPAWQGDMVRMGIALYGHAPSADTMPSIALRPALSWYARISMVKDLLPGEEISYGRLFRAEKALRVATIPVGYADGYARIFTNRARMLLQGHYVPVIGRVCMDYTMVDVSAVPDAQMGDTICIAGEGLPFTELAALSDTLHYERLSAIAPRVPRVYLRGGKCIAVQDYLESR